MRYREIVPASVFDIQLMEIANQYNGLLESIGIDTRKSMSDFLNLNAPDKILTKSDIGNLFFPVSIIMMPQVEFVNFALFDGPAKLLEVGHDMYVFEYNDTRVSFPENKNAGDMIKHRAIFNNKEEFDQFVTMCMLKISNWRFTYKNL